MTTVYISGPMRSKPGHNYDLFNEVEEALRDDDHAGRFGLGKLAEVINPARNFDGDKTLPSSTYMYQDITQVLAADALVLLPGWEQSEGAKLEVAVAKATGKKFYGALQVDQDMSPGHPPWTFMEIDEPSAGEPSPRAQSLDRAKSYVCGDRNAAYGSPTQDFARTAAAWTAYGYKGPNGRSLVAHDVALMMVMLKASRLMWSPERRDSWDDIAGYAACGWECVTSELEGIVE